MRRGRRRKVIIEKIFTSKTQSYISYTPPLFYNPSIVEPYRQNRFIVELENDHINLSIDSNKIIGVKVNVLNNERNLNLKTILNIGEWLDAFSKMTIAKIFILDAYGNISKMFDYDIEMIGHNFELKYSSEELMQPTVIYKIFD